MSGAPAGERRRAPRRALALTVRLGELARRDLGAVKFEATELSVCGLFVRSELLFEVGEELLLVLPIDDDQVVRTRCRVVRAVHAAGLDGTFPGMALELINLTEQERLGIERLLAANDQPTR